MAVESKSVYSADFKPRHGRKLGRSVWSGTRRRAGLCSALALSLSLLEKERDQYYTSRILYTYKSYINPFRLLGGYVPTLYALGDNREKWGKEQQRLNWTEYDSNALHIIYVILYSLNSSRRSSNRRTDTHQQLNWGWGWLCTRMSGRETTGSRRKVK